MNAQAQVNTNAGTESLEPATVEGPLYFCHGDIDFSLPLLNESMYRRGQLNLKVFIKEFALCNYANVRSLSRGVFLSAAGEFAIQRFANHPTWHTKLLKSSFENQFTTAEGASILVTCQTWLAFINSSTPLTDLLEAWLGATTQEAAVTMHSGAVVVDSLPTPQKTTVSASALKIVTLQPDQLPILVNENKSIHVMLPSKHKPMSAPVSHIHLVRQSSSQPDNQIVDLVPAFELSLIVTFESQALRDGALSTLGMEIFEVDKYEKGPVNVVPLANDDRCRRTSKVLPAGVRCDLRGILKNFFTHHGYVPSSLLTPGPTRNGIVGQCITALSNFTDFKQQWLLKVMTSGGESQALRVEVQPEKECQLCRPKLKDPRLAAFKTAGTILPESSTAAPPAKPLQSSGQTDREDAKFKVSEPSCIPTAPRSSHGHTNRPSAGLSQTNEPSAGPDVAAVPEVTHPPYTESQTQNDREAVQKSTRPPPSTTMNIDRVPEEEKSRRTKAGLCIVCGDRLHIKNGRKVRCRLDWAYKPVNASPSETGPSTGPSKRSASTTRYSGGNNKRGRRGPSSSNQSSFGSH